MSRINKNYQTALRLQKVIKTFFFLQKLHDISMSGVCRVCTLYYALPQRPGHKKISLWWKRSICKNEISDFSFKFHSIYWLFQPFIRKNIIRVIFDYHKGHIAGWIIIIFFAYKFVLIELY